MDSTRKANQKDGKPPTISILFSLKQLLMYQLWAESGIKRRRTGCRNMFTFERTEVFWPCTAWVLSGMDSTQVRLIHDLDDAYYFLFSKAQQQMCHDNGSQVIICFSCPFQSSLLWKGWQRRKSLHTSQRNVSASTASCALSSLRSLSNTWFRRSFCLLEKVLGKIGRATCSLVTLLPLAFTPFWQCFLPQRRPTTRKRLSK